MTHATMAASDLCLIPIRPTKADAHGNRPTLAACVSELIHERLDHVLRQRGFPTTRELKAR